MKRELWYQTWTEEYREGLPVGNGRLAAMMLGRPDRLRMALNHEWLWRGTYRFREYPDVSEHLGEVREALLQEDFLKGTELGNRYMGGNGRLAGNRRRVDPYQPAGDVWLEWKTGEVINYVRSLDLDTGLAQVKFEADCGQVCQRLFVSSTEDVIVAEMTTENPVDINVVLNRKEDAGCNITYVREGEGVLMKGTFLQGISFGVCMHIVTDGVWAANEGCVQVIGASKLLLFVQIGTDAKGKDIKAEMTFPEQCCFDVLFAEHAEQFRALKGDATLDVEVEESNLPTDQRIQRFREGNDSTMPLLYFEYGRYLMVSGSSGELPLNLQGKWNEDLEPAWDCDYHFNINLQMCYWLVETLGMKQAADTLFNFMEQCVPCGKEMAKNLYGCRGITLTLQTDVWGRVTPESCGWCVWIGAAAWLGQHMFMHWRHTKDVQFLKERCYPFLKEAAIFYEDYLVEKDGELWIVPSQSPENYFEGTGDWPVSLGVNSAMDIELVIELMNSVSECAEILNVDADKVEQWRSIVDRLPKLSTDSIGRLNEWDKERVEGEPGHRHMSHLYGVYPSQLFEPGSIEWKASEKSLSERLRHGGGHTGWSRSWVACLMARFGRSEEAWEHFVALIGDFATVSLLNLHPPRIFQIDGNMGGAACVCEMLMQSRRGELLLLPALPAAWKKGTVQNFRAQDGVTVSFAWENGKLTFFELIAEENQVLQVRTDDREWTVVLKAGERVSVK